METRDTKIKSGVDKINAKLKELETKKNALPKQKISSLSVIQDTSALVKKYIEMDELEKRYVSVKSELGVTEEDFVVDGHKTSEWKEGIKTQITLNNINTERRKLMEMKTELEKHYTEDHAVDEILAAL